MGFYSLPLVRHPEGHGGQWIADKNKPPSVSLNFPQMRARPHNRAIGLDLLLRRGRLQSLVE